MADHIPASNLKVGDEFIIHSAVLAGNRTDEYLTVLEISARTGAGIRFLDIRVRTRYGLKDTLSVPAGAVVTIYA